MSDEAQQEEDRFEASFWYQGNRYTLGFKIGPEIETNSHRFKWLCQAFQDSLWALGALETPAMPLMPGEDLPEPYGSQARASNAKTRQMTLESLQTRKIAGPTKEGV